MKMISCEVTKEGCPGCLSAWVVLAAWKWASGLRRGELRFPSLTRSSSGIRGGKYGNSELGRMATRAKNGISLHRKRKCCLIWGLKELRFPAASPKYSFESWRGQKEGWRREWEGRGGRGSIGRD